jgi:hypothetical protein
MTNAGGLEIKCYDCSHKENVPGDAHIFCNKYDKSITGDPHGIRKGWFFYPVLFDPVWMTSECKNFEKK